MQKTNFRILSTRPLPEALVQQAAEQGVLLHAASFIQTQPIIGPSLALHISQLFQKPITAVFTSANAVTAVADYFQKPKGWKVFCISNTTARLVTELFKSLIAGMAANAATLADEIVKQNIKKVYFFCGNLRRDALPEKLRAAGIEVEELVVYQTTETPTRITTEYDAILFYSPSAVHSFFSINTVTSRTQLFAIGFTTAESILPYTRNPVSIAGKTSKEELVKQVIEHLSLHNKPAA